MTGWTIDELAERVAEALAVSGVSAPNGRVTLVPDRRVIRWYATIGLLDPPLRTRGRTARYGQRHLLQLVAVKRRQAEGHPLTEIQAELAGATDAMLRRIAALPPPASRSWSVTAAVGAATDLESEERDGGGEKGARGHGRFWAETPDLADLGDPARDGGATPAPDGAHAPVLHYAVPLHPAVTLTLPQRPTGDDLAAIHAAARPLLDLLADRGLLTEPRRPR